MTEEKHKTIANIQQSQNIISGNELSVQSAPSAQRRRPRPRHSSSTSSKRLKHTDGIEKEEQITKDRRQAETNYTEDEARAQSCKADGLPLRTSAARSGGQSCSSADKRDKQRNRP